MDTKTLKQQGLTELQEMIARLGGWPVVQGEGWRGGKNFKWWELSSKAAGEGSTSGDMLNIREVMKHFDPLNFSFNCRNNDIR